MTAPTTTSRPELPEDILDPGMPIIDCHHHLWQDGPRKDYPQFTPEMMEACFSSGHNIRASVYIEADSHYLKDGPEMLRPVGETIFARKVGERSDTGPAPHHGLCAGIVGAADLALGDAVDTVLEAHIEAAGGRFRGIRGFLVPDPRKQEFADTHHRLLDPAYRAGLARLAAHGLTFEAMMFHFQLPDLAATARALPEVLFILNHVGTPAHFGPHAGRRKGVFAEWSQLITEAAVPPNVMLKLGGMNMFTFGIDWASKPRLATSDELVAETGDYFHRALEVFGPERCMFESNFPPDSVASSYATLWNAFKKIAAGYSPSERAALFHGNAARVYRLEDRLR